MSLEPRVLVYEAACEETAMLFKVACSKRQPSEHA